jgi:hypothetical protein
MKEEDVEIGPAIARYAPASILPDVAISLCGCIDWYNFYFARTKAILAAIGAISV